MNSIDKIFCSKLETLNLPKVFQHYLYLSAAVWKQKGREGWTATKKRHLEGLKGERGRKQGGDRVKRRFRIGTVRRNKRYSILSSLFNLRFDLPIFLFRPTSHPPGDDASTRSAGRFRRRGGRGHTRGCEDERAIFSYQWFYDRILPPSARPPALSPLPPPPFGRP